MQRGEEKMNERKQIRDLKQGIINKKIQSKPSFKNLFDLNKQKVAAKDRSPRGNNKSRSKSNQKSISQKKIGVVPVKKQSNRLSRLSYRKSQTEISIDNKQLQPDYQVQNNLNEAKQKNKLVQNNQNSTNKIDSRYKTQPLVPSIDHESKTSKYRDPYTRIQQSEKASPKSSKKPKNRSASKSQKKANQSNNILKMVINMKNDINKLQKIIKTQQEQIQSQRNKPQCNKKSKSKKKSLPVSWQTIEKLKKTESFLEDYRAQLKTQTAEINQSYLTQLENLSNQQNFTQKYPVLNIPKVLNENKPNTTKFQHKLKDVSQLLL